MRVSIEIQLKNNTKWSTDSAKQDLEYLHCISLLKWNRGMTRHDKTTTKSILGIV